MAGREDAHSSLEVHQEPPIATRSESPYPEEPVFVRTEIPHVQISPSLPTDSSFRDSTTTKRFRDSEATKVEYSPGLYDEFANPKARRNICGLQPITFWILVALISILCAAAIGGGIGGSFAGHSNESSSGRSSPDPNHETRSSSKKAQASSTMLSPTTTTELVTTKPSSTSYISAPSAIPTGNEDTHLASFKLTAHDLNSVQIETADLSCGYDGGPCQFQLESSRLYGRSSGRLQYVDCHNKFILNAESVNQSCLSFDAGFSISTISDYFYHGNEAGWYYCPKHGGWFTKSQGDECEERLWLVNATNLS